jgi:2,5-dihydroxypyridine 5,6-dioxygenase
LSVPFSYFDLGPGGPGGIAELMPGVRNLLDYLVVRSGERVLILTEHSTDPLVIGAIAAGAAYRDAEVHVLAMPPVSPGGSDRPGLSPIVTAAYAEADAVVSCVWWAEVHTAELFFAVVPRHRARFVSLHQAATAASLATGSRFPPELFYAIKRASLERTAGAKRIRVTTSHGTDVTFADPRIDTDAGPMEPGMWRPWPLGGLNFYPASTDGVVAVEETTVTGVPSEPLRIHVRDNLVAEIDGGEAADQLRRFSPGGYYLRHAFVGLNPKVRVDGAPQFEREKHAGAFYLGIDGLTDGKADSTAPGFAHCDCQFDRPTITVDDVPLVDRGRLLLLDEPAVREAAAEYGDPERLLDPNPRQTLREPHWRRL